MSGSQRIAGVAAVGAMLVLVGIAVWRLQSPDPKTAITENSDAPAETAQTTPQSSPGKDHVPPPQREPVSQAVDAPPRTGRQLRIRLDGLAPEVPWTKPLRFDLSGQTAARENHELEDRLAVGEDGVATVELPEWADKLLRSKLRIECRDPNYRPIRYRRRDAGTPREIVIEVEHVRVLVGRVIDAEGKPVPAARVTAFPYGDDKIARPALGTTTTAQDGSYRVQVHPRLALAVVAAAMKPMQLSGQSLMGYDGAIAATGVMRSDLLPGWLPAPESDIGGRQAAEQRIQDIVLSNASHIRGVLRSADGARVSGAIVRTDALTERWGTDSATGQTHRVQALELSDHAWVYHRDEGHITTFASQTTGALGDFEIAAWPGERRRIEVVDIPETLCGGGIFFDCDPAPSFVEYIVPTADLRATHRGKPVPYASFDLRSGKTRSADKNGRLRVAPGRSRVRARKGGLASRWHSPGQLTGISQVVDIEIEPRLTPITIEVTNGAGGDGLPRSLECAWRSRSGSETARHVRCDSDSRFRLFTPRGPLRLRVGGGTRGFLIPTWHDIEAGVDPIDLEIAPVFGGRLVLEVTKDDIGVQGRFALIGPGGNPVPGRFWTHVPGKLPDKWMGAGLFSRDGPQTFENPLPPGTYSLELDILQTTETRDFTIRPRETTTVRVRLP